MSVQQQLTVALGERSYPIYIGTGLLEDSSLLDRHIAGSQVAVITNDVLAELALPHDRGRCAPIIC